MRIEIIAMCLLGTVIANNSISHVKQPAAHKHTHLAEKMPVKEN